MFDRFANSNKSWNSCWLECIQQNPVISIKLKVKHTIHNVILYISCYTWTQTYAMVRMSTYDAYHNRFLGLRGSINLMLKNWRKMMTSYDFNLEPRVFLVDFKIIWKVAFECNHSCMVSLHLPAIKSMQFLIRNKICNIDIGKKTLYKFVIFCLTACSFTHELKCNVNNNLSIKSILYFIIYTLRLNQINHFSDKFLRIIIQKSKFSPDSSIQFLVFNSSKCERLCERRTFSPFNKKKTQAWVFQNFAKFNDLQSPIFWTINKSTRFERW